VTPVTNERYCTGILVGQSNELCRSHADTVKTEEQNQWRENHHVPCQSPWTPGHANMDSTRGQEAYQTSALGDV